jgi:hypothetical protein
MVLSAKQRLQTVTFKGVHRTVVDFVIDINRCLFQNELDIQDESELRERRILHAKRQPGELAFDLRPQSIAT